MANGVVVSVHSSKGFGWIKESEGGDAEFFFHRSALVNAEFDAVRVGDRVTFEKTEGPKGLRAEDVKVAA